MNVRNTKYDGKYDVKYNDIKYDGKVFNVFKN